MRIHYINLDAAADRRAALDANLADVAAGVQVARFAAIGAAEAADAVGVLSPGEKGCFLSHQKLLASRDPGETIFVLEDDAKLSPDTLSMLQTALAAEGDRWDILFADIAVPDRNMMSELIRRRRRIAPGRFETLNLERAHFAGATAYVVSGGFRETLNALLAQQTELNVPYDLMLRWLIHQGAIRAACVFPFATTVADSAFDSQIQRADQVAKDQALNLFRRMMWSGRDLAECQALAARLDVMCDDDARLGGAVFAAMSSSLYDTPG